MIFHQFFSGRSPPKYSYLRVSLPPRSGALNLAVCFNARDGREMNSASRQRRLNLPRHSERGQNSTVADATREKFTLTVGLWSLKIKRNHVT
jgi:hypothetical protein